VDHAQPIASPFPWRAATAVVGAVALVELIALVAIALVHLAPKQTAAPAGPQAARTQTQATVPAAVERVAKPLPQTPLRARSHVHVLVLNGNGVNGAAATAAARLQARGYPIAGSTDAARHDYARSMVMFVPGWAREARRLARDTGVRMVSPVDGLRRSQLRGSQVILLLGR
jgi:hypothetical protein